MKAIVLLRAAALTVLVSACASTPKAPAHQPVPPPAAHHRPVTPPPPQPTSVTPSKADWRDEPATPGTWSWAREGQRSVARFGAKAAIACDPASRSVAIELPLEASANQPVTLTATSAKRVLSGVQQGPLFVVSLPASDPLLDAIAFSRGRFMIETGALALYLPSWTEISRAIEDCR